jgi:hypothetical protein
MKTIHIDPHSDPRWERFVAEHPEGTIYHHPAWILALEMEYGQRGVHLACEDDGGSLHAILPLLYTQGLPFCNGNWLYGRRLSSLPRTPIAGPLYRDVEAARAVLTGAVEQWGGDGEVQLQIKMQDDRLNGLMEGLVGVPWRESYLLPLRSNRASEFRIVNSRHRKSVQGSLTKARRSGILARHAEHQGDLRQWYRLYLKSMRSHAVPPRSYRYFSLLWQLLRPLGLMQLILAEQERQGKRELLAGSIYFSFGRTTTYAFNGSSKEAFDSCSNDLVSWCAITEAMEKGQVEFDFGEVPEGNRGLAWFKGKWGARPVRLFRYYLPGIAEKEDRIDRSGRYGSHLVEAVWRRLPLGATAFLGDQIYRYL